MGKVRAELIEKLHDGVDPYIGLSHLPQQLDKQGWGNEHPYLTDKIELSTPQIIVEIGVWKGGGTIAMARKLRDLNIDAVVISIDTWLGSEEHYRTTWKESLKLKNGRPTIYNTFMANVRDEGLEEYVLPLSLDSINASYVLDHFRIHPEIIHLDAGHDYTSVFSDLKRWWPILRRGGWLIGDDYYVDGVRWIGVERAFAEFFKDKLDHPIEHNRGKCRLNKTTS